MRITSTDSEKQIIDNHQFLLYTFILNHNNVVIELCKLYPKNKEQAPNHYYGFWQLVLSLRKYPDLKGKFSDEDISYWQNRISKLYQPDTDGRKIIERLHNQRSKWITHLSEFREDTKSESGLSILDFVTLFRTGFSIVNAIHQKVFGTEPELSSIEAIKNDLVTTIKSLTP